MKDQTCDSPRLFDSDNLKSRLMDDEELIVQMLEACMPDLNANFRDFVEALELGEVEKATMRIHAMKGASQNADLTAVSELTLRIEQSLRSGETQFALESVERLEMLVGQTIGEMRRYLTP